MNFHGHKPLGARLGPAPTWAAPLHARAARFIYPATPGWSALRPAKRDPLGNLTIGNCVEAGALHLLQLRRNVAWRDTWAPNADEAEVLYGAWGGYDGTPATDQGTDDTTAMRLWGTQGVPAQGMIDLPWVGTFNPHDMDQTRYAINAFGGTGLILNLPLSAQSQQDVWSLTTGLPRDVTDPGTWGLHFVPEVDYDGETITCDSWAEDIRMTPGFLQTYAVRGWTTLSKCWADTEGMTPAGFDHEAARADQQALTAA